MQASSIGQTREHQLLLSNGTVYSSEEQSKEKLAQTPWTNSVGASRNVDVKPQVTGPLIVQRRLFAPTDSYFFVLLGKNATWTCSCRILSQRNGFQSFRSFASPWFGKWRQSQFDHFYKYSTWIQRAHGTLRHFLTLAGLSNADRNVQVLKGSSCFC